MLTCYYKLMGRIHVKAKVKFREQRTLSLLVDSGADSTTIGLNAACKLGLDVMSAPIESRTTVGKAILKGFRLDGVTIETRGRKATLDDVFVPVVRQEGKRVFEIDRNEEALLGHDFLQKSRSILDFKNDTLRGLEPETIRLHEPTKRLRATKADRAMLRSVAYCEGPKRR